MTDFLGLMKQATQLKARMEEMQAELDQVTVEGSSGGGLVVVTLSAKGDMKGVRIDPSLVKPDEKEEGDELTRRSGRETAQIGTMRGVLEPVRLSKVAVKRTILRARVCHARRGHMYSCLGCMRGKNGEGGI